MVSFDGVTDPEEIATDLITLVELGGALAHEAHPRGGGGPVPPLAALSAWLGMPELVVSELDQRRQSNWPDGRGRNPSSGNL